MTRKTHFDVGERTPHRGRITLCGKSRVKVLCEQDKTQVTCGQCQNLMTKHPTWSWLQFQQVQS